MLEPHSHSFELLQSGASGANCGTKRVFADDDNVDTLSLSEGAELKALVTTDDPEDPDGAVE